MNTINDGGPAFPGQWYDFQPCTGDQVVREQWSGMTLRDYFAAKALQGWMANPTATPVEAGVDNADPQAIADVAAAFAYMVADAMLKARGGQAMNDPCFQGASMTDHWCTYCNGVNTHNCQFNPNVPRVKIYTTNTATGPDNEALLRQALEALLGQRGEPDWHTGKQRETALVRNAVLEEVARVCEDLDEEALAKEGRLASGHECAAAIRAMKEQA